MDKNKIFIFDTTLRDGEQAPGFSMNMDEKLIFAEQLEKLGVDIIEAGFPVISDGDFEATSLISQKIKNAQVAGLARANPGDIEAAARAIEKAVKPRIHTFISSSDIHIEHQLNKTRDEVLEQAVRAVKDAKSFTDNVEFSPMDATRSDRTYLCEMLEAVIEAGATTLNIPDTVGYAIPREFYDLIKLIKNKVKGIDKTIISVHCHNDLGVAVANSLAAIEAGARQVECSVNGIGERAGNTAMEELVMAIKTRSDIIDQYTDIDTRQIIPTSKLLMNITGVAVQPNKAIVGDNAFAHESGIHQDGMLKNATTYEIMRPEDVGIQKSKLVLGKHSGRHAILSRLAELGHSIDESKVEDFFERFKTIADRKKEIFDEDLLAITGEVLHKKEQNWRYSIENVQISTGMFSPPMSMVTLKDHDNDDAEVFEVAHGNGGVDAGINAVKKITGTSARLKAFNLVAITGGSDALCEVSSIVEEEFEGKTLKVFGNGMSIDISVAGVHSFVDALNKIDYMKKSGGVKTKPEEQGI